MIIPIGHDKGLRRTPYVTLGIIVLCLGVHIYRVASTPSEEYLADRIRAIAELPEDEQQAGVEQLIDDLREHDIAYRWGYVPARGFGLNAVRSAFVHIGWLHLIFNMLFLWLAGANLEDRWGRAAFAVFYVAAAAAGSLAYGVWNRGSGVAAIGASGAIAGCMGAFLVCYYRTTIRLAYWWWFRIGVFEARAFYALPIWFGTELLMSYFEAHGVARGVAHSAHVGGFAFGLAVAAGLRFTGLEQRLITEDEREDDWYAHNPQLEQAMTYARTGNSAAALGLFRHILAERPDDVLARGEVVRLALELRDFDTARPLVEAVVLDRAQGGDASGVVDLWRQLEPAELRAQLGERALVEVARSALDEGDLAAQVAVAAVRQLVEQHGNSALLPGLLWRTAELQDRIGRPDLGERTLQLLVQRFPFDPFAERARARLRGVG